MGGKDCGSLECFSEGLCSNGIHSVSTTSVSVCLSAYICASFKWYGLWVKLRFAYFDLFVEYYHVFSFSKCQVKMCGNRCAWLGFNIWNVFYCLSILFRFASIFPRKMQRQTAFHIKPKGIRCNGMWFLFTLNVMWRDVVEVESDLLQKQIKISNTSAYVCLCR